MNTQIAVSLTLVLAVAAGLAACEGKDSSKPAEPKKRQPTAEPVTTTATPVAGQVADSPNAAKTAPTQPATTAPTQPAKTAPAQPAKTALTQPSKTAPPKPAKEIVFDPRKPPAGYTNCHRNHCHKVGGGVASYAQVMQEMGYTKLDAPKTKPMPPAPADVAAAPATAEKTASGLAHQLIRAGDGINRPSATSVVTVHYTGWTTDGKPFDSSVSRGKPASFPLNRVIPGWTEGVQLMSIGEERRFWIPEELAYKGRSGAPQGMLVFDVELLAIRK